VFVFKSASSCLSENATLVGQVSNTVATQFNGPRIISLNQYDDLGEVKTALVSDSANGQIVGYLVEGEDEDEDPVACDEGTDGNWDSDGEAQIASMLWGVSEAG